MNGRTRRNEENNKTLCLCKEKRWEKRKDGKNEDRMRKTMREDTDTKGQQSGKNQFPLGVTGSEQWSAKATL